MEHFHLLEFHDFYIEIANKIKNNIHPYFPLKQITHNVGQKV